MFLCVHWWAFVPVCGPTMVWIIATAARDLLPLKPSILRARLEDCGDTPPLVLVYGGGRSLSAVEAVAYGEIRQRRIWVGKLIEIERSADDWRFPRKRKPPAPRTATIKTRHIRIAKTPLPY